MDLNTNIGDSILVKKLRKGDVKAFDAVFEKYGNRLFGFVLKYLKSKEEAEELVQDVFLKIWENRKSLKSNTSLKSYLFTITYHNICKSFRKKQLKTKLEEEIESTNEISRNTEEQTNYDSLLELIERLIDRLPPRQKEVFKIRWTKGYSSREIAKEMNISPGTVDNHISATLKYLRKHISEGNPALSLIIISLLIK